MRVNLNSLRARVMMTEGLVGLQRVTVGEKLHSFKVGGRSRDCERQTFCRERANEVASADVG
jgi:hypothetical protein